MDIINRLNTVLENYSAPGPWELIITYVTADPHKPEETVEYQYTSEDEARAKAAWRWKGHNMGAQAVRSIILQHGDREENIPNPRGDEMIDDDPLTDPDGHIADQLDFGQHIAAEMKEYGLDIDMDTNRITDLQKGYSFHLPTKVFLTGNRYKIVEAMIKLAEELRELDIRPAE